MKQEYVNAFLCPAKNVWETELGQSLEVVSAEVVSHQFMAEDITAVIGISGSVQGNVLYEFSRVTAEALVKVMVGEEDVDARRWDEYHSD